MTPKIALGIVLALLSLRPYMRTQIVLAAQTQSRAPDFSIVLSLTSTTNHMGNPINITITVTNITDHKIYWISNYGKDPLYYAFNYDLELNGKGVDTTLFNRTISGKYRRSDKPSQELNRDYIPFPFPPGRMLDGKINLMRLYHIKQPAKYTFQVSRYDPGSKTMVYSNIVSFTVVK